MSLVEMGRTVFGFRKTWLEVVAGVGWGVLVQFLPAWTSHLSPASELWVEKVMLALKNCGEPEKYLGRIKTGYSTGPQQVIRHGACYCLTQGLFFLN